MYSLTYGSFIAFALIMFLKKANIEINENDAVKFIETAGQIISAIGVFWGRYRAGGISILGNKK